LKVWDNEIERAISHPIRRRIIECLLENDLSFSELMKCSGIINHGRFGHHLRKLGGLVVYEPSMRKYRLTGRGQLAAELIWDAYFLIAGHGVDLEHEPKRYVRRLRLGDHAVLFYDSEDIKREISFLFLLAGLLKGEAVVYVVSEHKLDSESREIQRCGINLDKFRKGVFTIMSADEWYLRKGEARAERIIANWQKLLKENQKAGFTGLHAAGEVDVFIKYAKSKEMLRYEATLGRQLSLNLCALCLYDTHKLDEEQFLELNKRHGHSIFKGMAVKTK